MSIYETAVKKPITTALIFVAIAILGFFSWSKLSVELLPQSETNTIMVVTAYPGASAEDIESNVTKALENSLNSVPNLKHITSRSSENTSVITLEFQAGTSTESATNDTRDKIDAVRSSLPKGINQPVIFKFSAADIPIAILSVESVESADGLKRILEEQVVNPLARIEGVGSVSVVGASERVIQVYADPYKLESYGLSLGRLSQMIAAENMNIPAGQIDLGSETNTIRVKGEFVDPSEISRIVVASRAGANVYLSDVATVQDVKAERQQENYTNGKSGALVVINKQSGGNAVAVSKLVRQELPRLQRNLPSDIKLSYLIDTSSFITNTINSLQETIVVTFIIVMIVVYIFLGRSSATFIVILTIPVSLIGSLIYLFVSGNTLNVISLSSLSIAIGMVVDDAIVVLENITTHIERGSYPKQAAVYATNEVGISVVASTLTMLAVFLPLTMISGQSGQMFRQLGWMISVVMIVSTLAALSLIPMLSSQMLRRNSKPNPISQKLLAPFVRFLDRLDEQYARMLAWCITHRKATILSMGGLFILSLALFPFIKTELMPSQDVGFVQIKAELPVGTRVEETRELAQRINDRLHKEISAVDQVSATLGAADGSNTRAALSDNGTNIVTFYIGLKPRQERESQDVVSDQILAMLGTIPDLKKYSVERGDGGGNSGGNLVKLDLFGYDFIQTDSLARKIQRTLEAKRQNGKPIVSQVVISRKDFTPELNFVFDREKLAEEGLSLSSASSFLRDAIGGNVASYYRDNGEEYKIRVSLAPEYRRSLDDITNIQVTTPQGKLVRLSELGHIEESSTPPTIERKDRSRVITLSISGATGVALSDVAKATEEMMQAERLPADISYKIGGTYETQQETFGELLTLLGIIVLLVFIVMASQFESLRLPFVIMFSVPFAFTGVFLGLVITQIPLGSMAFVGLIMLVGIVVKNGIVLIDYTLLCRERGIGIRSSVVMAGKSRLRPVLMTTLTTVLGMVPMALGIGEGSEMWQSMGVSVAFGLTVSTLVTLVLIPTLYTAMEGRLLVLERRLLDKKLERKAAAKTN